jgi:glutathione synthase
VRPRTLISRDRDEIAEFARDPMGSAVLKPLHGSGGASVFMLSMEEAPNLNQMLEAIGRDGYLVAQEFLAEAAKGDANGGQLCSGRNDHAAR